MDEEEKAIAILIHSWFLSDGKLFILLQALCIANICVRAFFFFIYCLFANWVICAINYDKFPRMEQTSCVCCAESFCRAFFVHSGGGCNSWFQLHNWVYDSVILALLLLSSSFRAEHFSITIKRACEHCDCSLGSLLPGQLISRFCTWQYQCLCTISMIWKIQDSLFYAKVAFCRHLLSSTAYSLAKTKLFTRNTIFHFTLFVGHISHHKWAEQQQQQQKHLKFVRRTFAFQAEEKNANGSASTAFKYCTC